MKDNNNSSGARELPGTEEIKEALSQERRKVHASDVFHSTVFIIVTVIALLVVTCTLLMPVLRIYGQSMESTLSSGDMVLSVKSADIEPGDIIAFYYNNSILVKRVIAKEGDWVDIDQNGNVTVNSEPLEEPYLSVRAYGDSDVTNITLPYQVPTDRLFVMGDNRATSIDSRNTSIGCVAAEQIVGKIVFRFWPLEKIGMVR